tara:strand:- start:457 stop:1350 length:894 start_codon:yes stop_codon:yes gene_type:complete
MKIDKWLYFRTVADEDNDDGDSGSSGVNPTSICFPASAILAIAPSSDTAIRIKVKNLICGDQDAIGKRRNYNGKDIVILNVTAGKTHEVMEELARLINSKTHSDGFIVVADDMTTNYANSTVSAKYFHPDVTSCGDIEVYQQPQGVGIHEYYEEVNLNAAADADGEVVGSLSISLPAQCILLEGALTSLRLSDHANSSVALNFHSSAVADAASVAGTEWIGADASGNTTIPDANLNCGSGDVLNDTIHSGSVAKIDRATAVTHFALQTCEDSSGATTNALIGVYIKWWGGPAVSIAD